MPLLTDIATISIGKQRIADGVKGLYSVRRTLPGSDLTLATRLRTTVNVGNESQLDKSIMPLAESNGIFASWSKELNRVAANDLYKSEPLNEVKKVQEVDVKKLRLDEEHKKWLAGVDARMESLGIK